MPHHKRAELLEAATAFCTSFAQKASTDEILQHFSSSPSPEDEVLAFEHGHPSLAPFLGRPFRGLDGVRSYFSLVASLLDYEDMRFGEYVVDAAEGRVTARGAARFTWRATGESWDEVFVYVLAFDADRKVRRYEIWADSGAAYLASKGKLREVEAEAEGRA
ncbi:hypothetical protein AAE478_003849 [Parahypoxylon ruwenzoriense]